MVTASAWNAARPRTVPMIAMRDTAFVDLVGSKFGDFIFLLLIQNSMDQSANYMP
jgi:hypothetical protein